MQVFNPENILTVQILSSNRAIALQTQGECGVRFNQSIKQSNKQTEKQID
jgi:hypothetical protein